MSLVLFLVAVTAALKDVWSSPGVVFSCIIFGYLLVAIHNNYEKSIFERLVNRFLNWRLWMFVLLVPGGRRSLLGRTRVSPRSLSARGARSTLRCVWLQRWD